MEKGKPVILNFSTAALGQENHPIGKMQRPASTESSGVATHRPPTVAEGHERSQPDLWHRPAGRPAHRVTHNWILDALPARVACADWLKRKRTHRYRHAEYPPGAYATRGTAFPPHPDTAYSMQHTADSRRHIAYSTQHTAYSIQPDGGRDRNR